MPSETAGCGCAGKKEDKKLAWKDHVMDTYRANNVSFGEAMKLASATYRSGSTSSAKHRMGHGHPALDKLKKYVGELGLADALEASKPGGKLEGHVKALYKAMIAAPKLSKVKLIKSEVVNVMPDDFLKDVQISAETETELMEWQEKNKGKELMIVNDGLLAKFTSRKHPVPRTPSATIMVFDSDNKMQNAIESKKLIEMANEVYYSVILGMMKMKQAEKVDSALHMLAKQGRIE